jgi:23S rRNA (pseudouridine1915-N3)-methyltransferase
MKIQLITVGSPNLSFAKEWIQEYKKRITRFADLDLIHVKENKQTSQKILNYIGNDFCILLDELGKEYTSLELSEFLEKRKNQSQNITMVIGGPNGHVPKIQDRADILLSLSKLTFPHDIAMMLCLETLYRSLSISAGHPYHRN